MFANVEVEEIRDSPSKQRLTAKQPVNEIAYGSSKNQTERDVLRTLSWFKRSEQVADKQQRDHRCDGEYHRILRTETEHPSPILKMSQRKETFDDRNRFMNIERTNDKLFRDPVG
jgi:hypothetical protein